VWLGYKGPEGLEFRVTYWGYDQSARNDFVELGLEAATFDFEVAQEGSFCNWDVEVSGGIRWARMEDAATLLDIADDPIVLGRDFEGTGLTAAMAVRRQLGQSGFAVIGSTRASLLYGESTAFVAGDFSGMVGGNVPVSQIAIVANDHVAQIYEIRVGGEWSRELDCGARLFTSVAYEAQVWELAPFALGLLDSNVGFVGPAFAIGIDR
jgi:hypothetical protein